MNPGKFLTAGCMAIVLSTGIALAGPCNTAGKDAGSGPTPGHTAAQTTGAAPSRASEHPPTNQMDKASGDVATSSADAQRQMQGQPTAAQEAQGAKGKTEDDGC